ncbi:MAG: tetratricopeptide repeat protein [Thiohalomonadaceae bacterium]
MKWLLLFGLTPLLLGGCVLLPSQKTQDVDALLAQQQYGRALEILAQADPRSPEYTAMAERRREVEAQAANYEQTVRDRARQYIASGDWAAALDHYDEALARLPQSMVLRDGLAQLHQQQTQILEDLEIERLLAQANWLKTTRPTYLQIAQVDPRSRQTRQQLERFAQQANEIASQLALHGNRALANQQLDTANKTLLLAQDLSDSPAISESVAKLRQEQLAQRNRQQQQQQRQQQQILRLEKQYQAARDTNDYATARAHLAELRKQDPANQHWEQQQQVLEALIQARVETLLSRGINAYSRGHFEEAAQAWRETLSLDPRNKLAQDNLERAERVLQRFEELQQRQGGATE